MSVRSATGGHWELRKVLESPYIDYLAGPLSYAKENRAGDGPGHARSLMETIRIHRKLWLTEMDQEPIGTAEYPGGGDPAHRAESIAILKRNIRDPLYRGMGAWYYDHRIISMGPQSLYEKTGWWEAPELMAVVAELQKEALAWEPQPYIPQAKVALVYDTEMFYHISCAVENQHYQDPERFRPVLDLHHLGVLFDCVNLQDFDLVEWDRYRVVVFVATPLVPPALRDAISTRLKNNGRHIVWCYAPGYSDGNTLDVAHIRELTSLPVERVSDDDPEYGLGPRFHSPIPDQTFPDQSSTGQSSTVWTSHYFPNCQLTTERLRNILHAAGIPIPN